MKKTSTIPNKKSRYNPPFLGILSIITIAYLLYYLWWRVTSTLNPSALVFSWALLLAEAFGVISYILFAWMTKNVSPKYSYKSPKTGIAVDIFIPTYNESLDILEATLVGCNRITYPHQTYILDDGARGEVQRLATRLGSSYISRPTHEHAKAGNINFALPRTQGEFIVILDADMVPQPGFIERSLGYFEDNNLGFIQMPQEFYNWDSIQHSKRSGNWHEQSLFFRVIQPGKNYSNSAFWCGSPSIVRRTALEDVGGVATETVTEDIHTSVRMHSRGWSSLFLNEALAYGIAPQTINSFLLQRLRWAQGTMQLYRSKESPLWIRGLSLKQRLSYLSSFLAYFESFQKLILILMPILIILFNVFPMNVSMSIFMLHWIPYFTLNVLSNQIGGRGHFRYFQTEKYNILKMAVFIQSTLMLFNKSKLKFKVTPKSVDYSVYKNERKALRSYMVILGLIFSAILLGLGRLTTWQNGRTQEETYIIVLVWAVYNAMVILIGVWEVLRRQHERAQYRFQINLDGQIYNRETLRWGKRVQISDISLTGAGLILHERIPLNMDLSLQFNIPGNKQINLPVNKIQYQRNISKNEITAGISFLEVTNENRTNLFEYLFVDLPGSLPEQDRQKTDQLSLPLLPIFSNEEPSISALQQFSRNAAETSSSTD